jgi:hypothetical protein
MLYAKIAAIVIALGLAYWKGYDTMKDKHLLFVAEVKRVGEAQEAASKSVIKQAEIITEGVKDEYETRIASLRAEYARRMRNTSPSSCPMPPVPKAAAGANAATDDIGVIGNCALETAKLVALQKWISKQQENQK